MNKKHINIFAFMLLVLLTAAFVEVVFSFIYLVFYAYLQIYSVEFEFLTLYDYTPMLVILSIILLMLEYLIIKITYWFNRKYFVTSPTIARLFGYFVFSGFTLYKLVATILDMKLNALTLISSVIIVILVFVANDSSFKQLIDNYDMDIDVNIEPGKIIATPNQTLTMEQIQELNNKNIENSFIINNNKTSNNNANYESNNIINIDDNNDLNA